MLYKDQCDIACSAFRKIKSTVCRDARSTYARLSRDINQTNIFIYRPTSSAKLLFLPERLRRGENKDQRNDAAVVPRQSFDTDISQTEEMVGSYRSSKPRKSSLSTPKRTDLLRVVYGGMGMPLLKGLFCGLAHIYVYTKCRRGEEQVG